MNSESNPIVEPMNSKPILFSANMVRALLDGRKTMTRRIVKMGKRKCLIVDDCPYGQPGDLLWVRETWHAGKCADTLKPSELDRNFWIKENFGLWYKADNAEPILPITPKGKTRVSIHIPRWASRLTLKITDVRIEKLQDISEQDAIAEGVEPNCSLIDHSNCSHDEWIDYTSCADDFPAFSARESFHSLWQSINGPESWSENPWVWVVKFDVHQTNVDEFNKSKVA